VSTGTVKWFSPRKGFGFILPDDDGEDLFVHRSEIKMDGYATLDEGQRVKFEIEQGEKGPYATNVIPSYVKRTSPPCGNLAFSSPSAPQPCILCFQKNYTINTFHSHRLLNPISH